MAETLTAWSNIHHHDGEKRIVIKPGDTVSQDKLGVDDDTWKEWKESGVVRKAKWPKDLDPSNPNGLSPNAHRLEKLREERTRIEAELSGLGADTSDDDNEDGGSDDANKPTQPPTYPPAQQTS